MRNYKIADNFLDLVGTKVKAKDYKSLLCISVAELFFISVDWLERCIKRRQSKAKADHIISFERQRESLKNIMMDEKYFGNEENFLRVSLWIVRDNVKIQESQ